MLKLLFRRYLQKKENYPKIHHCLAGIYAFTAWTAAIYMFCMSLKEYLPTTPKQSKIFLNKIT